MILILYFYIFLLLIIVEHIIIIIISIALWVVLKILQLQYYLIFTRRALYII